MTVCTSTDPSARRQTTKTAASASRNTGVDTAYGMSRATWTTSAAMVPKTPTIDTAAQYMAGT
nr:hypothetical protein [Microbacterium testaceum]